MPMPQRILIGRKWDILAQMIAEGKSDAEIKLALGRPNLDMPYFRKRGMEMYANIKTMLDNAPSAKSMDFVNGKWVERD